jgi:tetratricopeptide (TPR) repeat protein
MMRKIWQQEIRNWHHGVARLSGVCAVLALFAAVWMLGASGVHAASDADAAIAARKAYNDKISATYNDHFGRDSHFLPSNMTTDTGQFIDPKTFPTAQYCGHCHQESHAEWRESAHSNSNRAPWYLRNVGLLNHEKGIEFSRHCEGCHDPVAMAAGSITEGPTKRRPFDADGVTCMVCHSIEKVDARGTGSYVLGVPAVLLDENGQPVTRPVSDAEILAHLDRHSAAVMKPFYKTSEFCASCHKAALPTMLNGYKWQRAFSVYDEWQNASFSQQNPLPFYTKASLSTCETCHMQKMALRLPDAGAKHGELASHRWLGANTLVPQYYKYPDQAAAVVKFLQNNVFNIDLFGVEHGATAAQGHGDVSAPLGLASLQIAPREHVVVDVVIQNKGIGHSHVPEQRDMYESWVNFTVKDQAGKVLEESGYLQPDGALDASAHSFTNRLINVQGGLNDLHQVWDNRIVAYNNTIQSGRSQLVRYAFQMPESGAVSVTATVKYRRFDQHFVDFAMSEAPGSHYSQPVVTMQSSTRVLSVGENQPTRPGADENPEWMRWNNYGIALLDAQQYAASVDAFAQVAKLRPDYADAYTNQAIVEIQWERYDRALPNLNHALQLLPNNARARYYRALVERNEGNLDEAIADLELVVRAFPRSRDAHRELGFSFYQQHKYPDARTEYLAVQAIDPDDLAAHYNLAILYRRLGMKDKAAEEAKAFAEQKDDPGANMYALDYLKQHAEIANESVPWHLHELSKPAAVATGPIVAEHLGAAADAGPTAALAPR